MKNFSQKKLHKKTLHKKKFMKKFSQKKFHKKKFHAKKFTQKNSRKKNHKYIYSYARTLLARGTPGQNDTHIMFIRTLIGAFATSFTYSHEQSEYVVSRKKRKKKEKRIDLLFTRFTIHYLSEQSIVDDLAGWVHRINVLTLNLHAKTWKVCNVSSIWDFN